MEIQTIDPRKTKMPDRWRDLLQKAGLHPDTIPEYTVLCWDGPVLAATGSRDGFLLKYLAVDPAYRGQNLTATVITKLRRSAAGLKDAPSGIDSIPPELQNSSLGKRHLFLYTKPSNLEIMKDLFFYPVAATDRVLLMEDQKDGLKKYLDAIRQTCGLSGDADETGPVGAVVMHCNPFTLGHRYLIETAAAECEKLFVFVLSEDKGMFPAADRFMMVRESTSDLANVSVLPSGPYMISTATFPTYFLPEGSESTAEQCALDAELFAGKIAPALGITRRYVGTEPLSEVTHCYNETLKNLLPERGIEVLEIPRIEINGLPVSASHVRQLIENGQTDAAKALVPPVTARYFEQFNLK